MTHPKPMPPASIVTPHKLMQTDRRVQARLLNRALGLSPSNSRVFRTEEQQHDRQTQKLKPSVSQENQPQTSPSRTSKARVFRCLSNTTATHHPSGMRSPPLSPSSSSSSSTSRAQAQRSALKSMFQPPASSPSRHMKRSPHRSHVVEAAKTLSPAFFGCRLDRSTLSSRPLRRSTPAENSNDDDESNKKKTVQFQPTVSVVRIPSHREYPSAVKKTLWGSTKEIKANAIRNTAEFIFDKCNWRKSTEENRFYRDTRDGTLIHPVHVQRYYAAMQKMKKQEQAAKKKLQQQQQEQEESENHQRDQQQQQHQQQAEEDDDQGREQPQHQHQKQREEEPEEQASRKRPLRSCGPSPIRRSNPDYEVDHPHPPKRQRRTIHVPIPQCRHPVYYTAQPYDNRSMYAHGCPTCMQQQENGYCYCYEQHHHHPLAPHHLPHHHHHQMLVMHPSYPPFPHHHHGQPFPPTEIAK